MRWISAAPGGRRWGLAVAALRLWGGVGASSAGTVLWYTGDFDGNNAIYNAVVPSVQQAYVYDEFIIPAGETWSITGVFSNDLMDTTTSSAYWEIRSGVSAGVGGQLLDSGTDAATQTATGKTGFGFTEYTVAVSGLSGLTLGPGNYWLTVAPVVGSVNDNSDISTTSGAGAIGVQPGAGGNSYVDGSYYYALNGGNDFEPASNYNSGSAVDFSMGVQGIVLASIPEPSSFTIAMKTLTLLVAARALGHVRRSSRKPP